MPVTYRTYVPYVTPKNILKSSRPGKQSFLIRHFPKARFYGFFDAFVRGKLATWQVRLGKLVYDPIEQQPATSQPEHHSPSKLQAAHDLSEKSVPAAVSFSLKSFVCFLVSTSGSCNFCICPFMFPLNPFYLIFHSRFLVQGFVSHVKYSAYPSFIGGRWVHQMICQIHLASYSKYGLVQLGQMRRRTLRSF